MKLVLALIGVFVLLGLTQRALTWRVQAALLCGIITIVLLFFLTWNY